MGRKLLGGAAAVLAAVREVASHAVWYLRYQVDGTPRDERQAPPESGGRS